MVSHSERKTRRMWKPNVQNKRFWSEFYGRYLKFRVTTSMIKKVKKLANGIDEYLTTTPNELLLYPVAIRMKRKMLKHARRKEHYEALAQYELQQQLAAAGGGGGGGGGGCCASKPEGDSSARR